MKLLISHIVSELLGDGNYECTVIEIYCLGYQTKKMVNHASFNANEKYLRENCYPL